MIDGAQKKYCCRCKNECFGWIRVLFSFAINIEVFLCLTGLVFPLLPPHILFKVSNNVKHSSPPEKRDFVRSSVFESFNQTTTHFQNKIFLLLGKQTSFEYVFLFCDKDLQQKRTNKKRCRKQCDLYQIDYFNT